MSCEKMPCGHCKSLEEDDHCGIPEHRYCSYCETVESKRAGTAGYMKLYDAVQAALKELVVLQPGYPVPVANAVAILKKSIGESLAG